MRSEEHLRPDLSHADALKLVHMIKKSSDHAGVIVMLSIANTLRYVTYTRASYSWKIKKHQRHNDT